MSGIQTWSRGKTYPATVVCVGGFAKPDNDATAEVWYRGVKIRGYEDHASAELIAEFLAKYEAEYGTTLAVERAKQLADFHAVNKAIAHREPLT